MAFRQNNQQIFQSGMNDAALDAQLASSPFNNGTISFGVSTEQIFTPVHSRAGSAPQPGNQSPIGGFGSNGRFSVGHCGPTSNETNPYFPTEPNDEWSGRDFQEGCDFLLAHNNTQDTNLCAGGANHIRGIGLRAPMLVSQSRSRGPPDQTCLSSSHFKSTGPVFHCLLSPSTSAAYV